MWIRTLKLILLMFPLAGTGQEQAVASGTILSDSAVAEAEPQDLKNEAVLFERIKDGVMLTLAECDLAETCSPSVEIPEVERILLQLDTRITTLTNRYMQDSDPTLEEAILLYADTREDYLAALDTLQSLPGATEDGLGEDAFGGGLPEDDFSDLFQDADEQLQ